MSRPPGISYAPGSPFRAVPYPVHRPLQCEDGAHHAITTTDREGVWLWVCLVCPAVREQGEQWRTP